MPRRPGVIGYPVDHSISPAIHQAALDQLGIDARYERWAVTPEALPAWVATLRAPDVLGANVTVPHKEAVLPLLDELLPAARAIGAVNTIVNVGGRLRGENTDAAGFARALQEAGYQQPGGAVVLLGAGGAARAIAHALLEWGVDRLTIVNRHLPRAEALVSAMQARAGRVVIEACALASPSLDACLAACDLLINATSVGMRPGERILRPDQVPAGALVVDIVYNPPVTPLLADAAARGARTLNGVPMLVYQAALAFELWTGQPPPLATMFRAAHEALA